MPLPRSNTVYSSGSAASITLGRGCLLMASGSGGLKPSAVAGGPSVTRLTHSRCSGVSGSGRPRRVAKKIVAISPMLHEIRKQMNACVFR